MSIHFGVANIYAEIRKVKHNSDKLKINDLWKWSAGKIEKGLRTGDPFCIGVTYARLVFWREIARIDRIRKGDGFLLIRIDIVIIKHILDHRIRLGPIVDRIEII